MCDPDVDDLAAQLSEFAAPEKKGGRPPHEERVIAGFEEVQRFGDKHGRDPHHGWPSGRVGHGIDTGRQSDWIPDLQLSAGPHVSG